MLRAGSVIRPRSKVLLGAALAVSTLVVTAAPALANTSAPTTINANAVINNPSGTVTVTVTGNWTWPAGQACSGRYGNGLSVGWWGIGSAATPASNTTLTSASEITATGQGINGTAPISGSITSTGSLQFPRTDPTYPNDHFYVGDYYGGSEIFTAAFCNAAQPPNGTSTTAFSGTYTATATYPNATSVPSTICVVTYDEHGTQGAPTTGPGGTLSPDFSPSGDADNSIAAGQFVASNNCGTTSFTGVGTPQGGPFGLIAATVVVAVGLVTFQAVRLRRRRHPIDA
jgi:hypothetical protein